MDVIITAGHSAEEKDPLYERTQGRNKALMPLAGRPMIAYVVDALAGIGEPGHILIYGLPENHGLDLPPGVLCLPGRGGIVANVEAGLAQLRELGSASEYTILTSSDIPLITAACVDAHIADCFAAGRGYDMYFTVVNTALMDARFPGARRSFLRLKDGAFTAGDLHLLRRGAPVTQRDLWNKLVLTRKNALRQALLIGVIPLLKVLTRRLTLPEAERIFERRFGLRGRVVTARFPELGMDVDKPGQAEIAERALLAGRAGEDEHVST